MPLLATRARGLAAWMPILASRARGLAVRAPPRPSNAAVRIALAKLAKHATRGHVLAAGWLAFVVYAYPGLMSTDSVDQLLQARHGPITDWHPPLMAFVWRWLDRVYTYVGPLPMLVAQSVAFLLGVDGILRRVLAPRGAALAAMLVLLFPPVQAVMAVIWKDSQMAGYMMAGTACLLPPSRRWRIAGLALFAVAAWIGVTVAGFAANAILCDRHEHPLPRSLALYDIAGTFVGAGALHDAEANELLDGARRVAPRGLPPHPRQLHADHALEPRPRRLPRVRRPGHRGRPGRRDAGVAAHRHEVPVRVPRPSLARVRAAARRAAAISIVIVAAVVLVSRRLPACRGARTTPEA